MQTRVIKSCKNHVQCLPKSPFFCCITNPVLLCSTTCLQTRPRIEKKVIMPCCHMVGLINSYSPLYMHSSICIFCPLIFKDLKLFPFMLETNNGSYYLTFMMKVCLYSVILCA
jgi:hypothetical protein